MYHYHTGEVKNPGFELMLVLIRSIIFVCVVITAGAVGMAAGLPAFVGGLGGGIVILALFCCRPFLEVIDYTCPHCGNKTRSIKNFGSYRCSNCGQDSRIEG
ncbi:MAG: hypothetical protein ACOY30_10400 [Bacillota bacterium]